MAAPPPDKELDRLQRLCRDGLPAVTVISGSNTWYRDQAMERVLAAVPADSELVAIEGQETEIRGLRAAADTDPDADDVDDGDGDGGGAAVVHCADLQPLAGGGLFARTAFVVVRRAERWLRRYSGATAAFLPRVAKGSGLVLETGKLDKRTRFAKELAQHGAVFEFRDLYDTPFGRPDRPLEGELVQWVMQQARKLTVPLQPEAALLFTAEVGKDLGELLAELQQLKDRLGPDARRKPLGPDDLRGELGSGFESTPFELAEAVLGGDRRRALRSLRAMFARGVKQKDGRRMDQGGLFAFATSWLFQSIGSVHEGRLLLDEGVPERDLAGRAGVRGFADRWLDQVRRNDRQRLERGLLAVVACQRERRFGGEDDDVLLERLLWRWFDGAPIPPAEDFEW